MALFTPRCPVSTNERDWITRNMDWLRGQFSDAPLHKPVILPTSEYFPPPYTGSDMDIGKVVASVAVYMGTQVGDIKLEFSDELGHDQDLARAVPIAIHSTGAAGTTHVGAHGHFVVTIDRSTAREPARLIAVAAHELAHARLHGEAQVPRDRKDGEPLTDLATVYLRMGVFNANAAYDFSRVAQGLATGWRTQRLGYLTEQMFGYALARYAVMRGEPDPPWARYLDTNPKVYMRQGLRYLRGQK
jgi:hypothetical protein